MCPIPIKTMCTVNELRQRKALITNYDNIKDNTYDNIKDFLKRIFWDHSNDTKRNPWVMLYSICQLITHSAIYTLPFTLHLCYKPLRILQMVTKSHKVHISRADGFPTFITSTLLKIGSWVSHSSRNTSFPH